VQLPLQQEVFEPQLWFAPMQAAWTLPVEPDPVVATGGTQLVPSSIQTALQQVQPEEQGQLRPSSGTGLAQSASAESSTKGRIPRKAIMRVLPFSIKRQHGTVWTRA
jgi:hypothetical protein